MAAVAVGDKARAPVLRDNVGTTVITTAAVYVNQVALVAPIPELNIILEPNASYALDGLLVYATGTTPAIKFTFSAPPGTTGMWSLQAVTAGGAGPANNIESLRRTTFNAGGLSEAGAAGSATTDMSCMPIGFIRTAYNGGALQFSFAQATPNASTTTLLAGSWIRVMRMA